MTELINNRKNIHVEAVASSENCVESFTERNKYFGVLELFTLLCFAMKQ